MDKQEIRASILRSVEREIDAWLAVEPKTTDTFAYEKTLFDRTLRTGKIIMENSRGKPSKDRNKKTVLTIFGRVALSKSHMLQHSMFKITTYMQSMTCILSQNVVFSEASGLLGELLNITLSAKLCQRVS